MGNIFCDEAYCDVVMTIYAFSNLFVTSVPRVGLYPYMGSGETTHIWVPPFLHGFLGPQNVTHPTTIEDLHSFFLIVANYHIHHQTARVIQTHVIEYRRGNQKCILQKKMAISGTQYEEKQRNMCWTPLYAISLLFALSHAKKKRRFNNGTNR